jgi:hypothetical protein
MGNPLSTIPLLPPAISISGAEQLWISQAGVDRRSTLGAIAGLSPTGAAANPNLNPTNFILYATGSDGVARPIKGMASAAATEANVRALDATCASLGIPWDLDTNIALTQNTTYAAKQIYGVGGIITTGAFALKGDFDALDDVQMFDAASTGYIDLSPGQGRVSVAWFGAAPALADNANAINRALSAALGFPRRGNHNMNLNRPVYVPGGFYGIRALLNMDNTVGFTLEGDERLTTRITQLTADTPVISGDGLAYGKFIRLQFVGPTVGVDFGLVHIDWTGLYPPTGPQGSLHPQFIDFDQCYFFCTGAWAVGVWISKSTTNQHNNLVFHNCVWSGSSQAAVMIGSSGVTIAQNAITIEFYGGDFQGHQKFGIQNIGGSVMVYDTTFEPALAQMFNEGYDVFQYNQYWPTTLNNCRTEGNKLAFGCTVYDGGVETSGAGTRTIWAANHAYSQGQFVSSTQGVVGQNDGRLYVCFQAGTSAAAEPNWVTQGGPGGGYYGGVNSSANPVPPPFTGTSITTDGSTGNGVINGNPVTFGISSNLAGWGIWIAGAGAGGGNYYGTVSCTPGFTATTLTLTPPPPTAVTAAAFRLAPLITDNGAVWMHWEFASIVFGSLSNTYVRQGYIAGLYSLGAIRNLQVTRPDWQQIGPAFSDYNFYYSRVGVDWDNTTFFASGGVNTPHMQAMPRKGVNLMVNSNPGAFSVFAQGFKGINVPVLWPGQDANGYWSDVGVFRGDGTGLTPPTQSPDLASTPLAQFYRAIVGVIGMLGKVTQFGADALGLPFRLSGGLGTGAGGGGPIEFYTQPVAASGSTVTQSVKRADIDAAGNVSVGAAALALTATDGFLYIPTCAGAPTGVPTAKTGRTPMIYDTTNNKFWLYNGAWRGVVVT